MFGKLGNLASLLRQAQQMGSRLNEIQERLRAERVRGVAGGGLVAVEMNGLGEALGVQIDPALVARGEREVIEDLLPAAINDAAAKAKELHVRAMESLAGELDTPALRQAFSQLGGTPPPE